MVRGLLVALAGLAACQSGPAPADSSPPNFVLIVADDLGYGDLGCYGNAQAPTPNIDRLAAEGTRFTGFYVTAPVCTPSRGSLLTGRYPRRNGLYEMIRNDAVNYGHRFTEEEYAVSPEMTLGMDLREKTVAQLLKPAGYVSGMVGKWDGGRARRFLPLQRGFDFFYGFANTGIDYYTHERYGIPSMFRGNDRIKEEGYATDLFARESIRFLRENRDRRFFLYTAFNAPHSASNFEKIKLQAPPELVAKFGAPDDRKAIYAAMMASLDAAVGRILKTLKELGLDERTVVMFTSDNGGAGAANNGSLRGKKGDLFEGGIRVPFIVRLPGRVAYPVSEDGKITAALDVLPLLLSWARTEIPAGLVLDGVTKFTVDRALFWEWRGVKAARWKEWKWVEPGGLFNLSEDPGEKNDLSATNPGELRFIKAKWEAWKEEMDESEPRGPFRDY